MYQHLGAGLLKLIFLVALVASIGLIKTYERSVPEHADLNYKSMPTTTNNDTAAMISKATKDLAAAQAAFDKASVRRRPSVSAWARAKATIVNAAALLTASGRTADKVRTFIYIYF